MINNHIMYLKIDDDNFKIVKDVSDIFQSIKTNRIFINR